MEECGGAVLPDVEAPATGIVGGAALGLVVRAACCVAVDDPRVVAGCVRLGRVGQGLALLGWGVGAGRSGRSPCVDAWQQVRQDMGWKTVAETAALGDAVDDVDYLMSAGRPSLSRGRWW